MSLISDARQAIADAISSPTGPDLRTYPFFPDNPQVPCAAVWLDDPAAEYQVAMNNGLNAYHFVITVLAGRASERAAQDQLDEYLSADSAASVKQALQGNTTLGTKVRVSRAAGYAPYKVGDVDYIGVQFHVDVWE